MVVTDLSTMTAAAEPAGDSLAYLVLDPGGSPVPRRATFDDVRLPGWGSLFLSEGGVVTALVADAFKKFEGFGIDGPFSKTVPDHTTDSIELTATGIYCVSFSLSCSFAVAANLDAAIYWNGAITNIRAEQGAPTGDGIVNLAGSASLSVGVAAVDLELFVRSSVTGDLTATQAQLSAHRLG